MHQKDALHFDFFIRTTVQKDTLHRIFYFERCTIVRKDSIIRPKNALHRCLSVRIFSNMNKGPKRYTLNSSKKIPSIVSFIYGWPMVRKDFTSGPKRCSLSVLKDVNWIRQMLHWTRQMFNWLPKRYPSSCLFGYDRS